MLKNLCDIIHLYLYKPKLKCVGIFKMVNVTQFYWKRKKKQPNNKNAFWLSTKNLEKNEFEYLLIFKVEYRN